jgi:hypothetical protein
MFHMDYIDFVGFDLILSLHESEVQVGNLNVCVGCVTIRGLM